MNIPKEIKKITSDLEKNGFEAYLVGGCVRDILRGEGPQDWDIATNAIPTEIQKIFPNNFSENKFGTVTVLTDSKEEKLKEIEITPYRTEANYTDKRHPDRVEWAKKLDDDLSRRDFTINAIAMDSKNKITDPFGGQNDLEKKITKAVGNPRDRFSEDALRMIRAIRFSCVLDFKIEDNTFEAIKENAKLLSDISFERIRDEFVKIIMSDRASEGIELLRISGLLIYIIPELLEGYGVGQNKHHIYDCYEHAIYSLKYGAKKKFNKYVRIATLLHDIGKPRVKNGEGSDSTFYNHEIVGAKMAVKILDRLKFPKREAEKIVKLVRYHLFYYNVGEVTESSVRRLVNKAGLENMEELLEVRMCDRIGSGVPKAEPYKLRHLKYIIEKVSSDPMSPKMLKINGNEIMELLKIKPGPKIGEMLEVLLSEIISDPSKNERDYLIGRVREMGSLPDRELDAAAKKAKMEREKIEIKKDEMTKKKYWVV